MNHKDHVVIIGGGTAGITVAAQLLQRDNPPQVTILDPARKHFYQPLWTLVGGGVFPKEESAKEEGDVIPPGAEWIPEAVDAISPDDNLVTTQSGQSISYDYLVVAAGLQVNWNKIPGLVDSVGKPGTGVCSNYSYETVASTWDNIRNFKGGTAVFTQPGTAVKCGGAPQKIMYLAEDHFRKTGIRDRCKVQFYHAKPVIFDVNRYANTLSRIIKERGMETYFQHELIELYPEKKQAVFANGQTGEKVTTHFDMIHVTPPMGAPDFLKNSPLGNQEGWVDVDKHTLQHTKFPNVFGLGDCSSLPTSKTGAAIRKQAPVVVENLCALRQGASLTGNYDGYTACPIVTGYGKLVLAEFGYDKVPQESFPVDQSQERYSMYAFKAYALPRLYWHAMLKGRM